MVHGGLTCIYSVIIWDTNSVSPDSLSPSDVTTLMRSAGSDIPTGGHRAGARMSRDPLINDTRYY